MSSQPVENNVPVSPSDTGSVKLPTTQELFDQVEKQKSDDTVMNSPAPQSAPSFTSNSAVQSATMPPTETVRKLDTVALMRAMSYFAKGQSRFIHEQNIGRFAAVQEVHIVALTTALEQLGVL